MHPYTSSGYIFGYISIFPLAKVTGGAIMRLLRAFNIIPTLGLTQQKNRYYTPRPPSIPGNLAPVLSKWGRIYLLLYPFPVPLSMEF
jgi:hypothetical protein